MGWEYEEYVGMLNLVHCVKRLGADYFSATPDFCAEFHSRTRGQLAPILEDDMAGFYGVGDDANAPWFEGKPHGEMIVITRPGAGMMTERATVCLRTTRNSWDLRSRPYRIFGTPDARRIEVQFVEAIHEMFWFQIARRRSDVDYHFMQLQPLRDSESRGR